MSSKIKWKGEISDKFPIQQGVREGGVLSTHIFKVYINNVLNELMKSRVEMKIGNIYTGTPTCADDIALLSDYIEELQIMLNTVLRNAKQDRVTIHPTKTNAVIINKGKTVRKNLQWNLGTTCITPTNQTKHLDQVEIGKPHQIWQSIGSSVTEVKRSINHYRIATGTYLLQTNIAKFSNNKETATCPLCGLEEEDMIHMLTSCMLLHDVRKTYLLRLKNIIIGYIGLRQ
ncbi:unnamed protein product [Mytilus coruscus]|uniref:Reverse transcriptase domain-containing protein n=1 Tax=Mytilus coruscus TaxID=42192 RepID=A0A6J8DXK8_MYTCO|nr:unnamed protein product [Mytilus coruscus]